MRFEGILNFADVNEKRRFLAAAGALTVPHSIEIKPYKPRRSNQHNRFYFGCIVKALCQFMEEQGEFWSPERAHEFIVTNTIGTVEVTNPLTGEVYTVRKETHGMDRDKFAEFVELAHAFIADFGIVVQTKDQFEQMERDAMPRKEQRCRVTQKQS